MAVVIPQTFRIELAAGFSVVAVLALSLARSVRVRVMAEFRITVHDEIAFSIAETVDLEFQELRVGEVDTDPLRIETAISVSTLRRNEDGALRGRVPDVFGSVGTISGCSSESVGTVAAETLVGHTNPRAEVREGAVDLVNDRSVDDVSSGRENDGLEEDGGIDSVLGVRVSVVVSGLNDRPVSSERSANVSCLAWFCGRGITNRRILETFSHVLASMALFDAILLLSIPDAAVIPQTRLFVVMG